MTRRFYLDGMDQLGARINAAGDVAWYLTDHQGSVMALADNNGAILDERTYDAFGNITSDNQIIANSGDRYSFTGLPRDPETGQVIAWRRLVDTVHARFDEEDPEGFGAGDANLYRYVGNDPTNMTDPTGMWGEWLSDLWEKHKSGWGVVKERFVDGLDKLYWAGSQPWNS